MNNIKKAIDILKLEKNYMEAGEPMTTEDVKAMAEAIRLLEDAEEEC